MSQDNAKILIVDDGELYTSILKHLLEPFYTVFIAKNGQKAITMATEILPDLILLDIILPDISGFEVFTKLMNIEYTKNIPVIFITGSNNTEDEEKGLFLGAVDYITKPFANSTVMARVNTHIQTTRYIRTIEQLCSIDPLTNLSNRRGFDSRLSLDWAKALREKQPISLLFIDLDKFKHYNDTYGHQFGDLLIQTAANIYKETLEHVTGLIARWGGDEFVVLLPNTELNSACMIAERIRKCAANTLVSYTDGTDVSITVSIGVNTILPTANDTIDDFLAETDKALYAAKESGRNRFCFPDKHSPDQHFSEPSENLLKSEDAKPEIAPPVATDQIVNSTNKKEQSSFLTHAKSIPYLEVDKAVGLIGGSVTLYKKIISIVVMEIPQSIKQIENYLHGNNDLDAFVVKIHGMIGSLCQIGCFELVDLAIRLEKAAKSGDEQYCREYYSTFKKELLHFYNQANAILQNTKTNVVSPDVSTNHINAGDRPECPSKHILVIDDDTLNLYLTKELLSAWYKVHRVDSGNMALNFLEKQRPDLILLDMEMPNMSGTDLFNIIKMNPKLSDIPVIFITANSDTESEADAFKLGATDYIRKPINDVVLLARIRMHLEP